jgi:two-component system cell cycle sensor histidine kinase/response regulator CckA
MSDPAASATVPCILVVEDETIVRLMICRMLRGLGFDCVEAVNGREALRIVRQRELPFTLVLTDLIMPVMSGAELCTRLAEEHPQQRVLGMSAYPRPTLSSHGAIPRDLPFIQKPFLPGALAQAIQAATAEAPAG